MVNPFGEDSNSIFAWKERYKQLEYEKTLLQSRVSELKAEVDNLRQIANFLNIEKNQLEEELSKTKKELLIIHKVSKERQKQILDLEKQVDHERVEKLKRENIKLKAELEELQGNITRGTTTHSELGNKLSSTITPLMLREYDPKNERYTDAFIDLVEAVLEEGDTIERIIGILIKYGGKGPMHKLREKIDVEEFEIALEVLKEEQIIKIIDDEIILINSDEMVEMKSSWEELPTEELFQYLIKIIENEPTKVVISSINKFRDSLQEREVPLSTMLFQIRKMLEGFQKNTINRDDAIQQVNQWYEKIFPQTDN